MSSTNPWTHQRNLEKWPLLGLSPSLPADANRSFPLVDLHETYSTRSCNCYCCFLELLNWPRPPAGAGCYLVLCP
uniref:Uncharacterized protein n=1 Tax=Arundo donax TaxID=35708 RepID=A0A0A9C8K7_ARUDO